MRWKQSRATHKFRYNKRSILSCYNGAPTLHVIISIITDWIQTHFGLFSLNVKNISGKEWTLDWQNVKKVRDIFGYIL